jgi:hypothetical protein
VDLPPWLAPGLAAHLQFIAGGTLIMEADTPIVRVIKHQDPAEWIQRRVAGQPILSFDELNWPTAEQLREPAGGYYACCAHLFVQQLLRQRDAPDSLRLFLRLLPRHLNWQTGFLKAFEAHFASLREIEKWWLLYLTTLGGRETGQNFSLKESWEKLDEILQTPVRLPATATNQVEGRQVIPLQRLIAEWEPAAQKGLLREKINQLDGLRSRVSPPLRNLVRDYRETLAEYLERRGRALKHSSKQSEIESARLAARSAIERLNILDELRGDLRQQTLTGNLRRLLELSAASAATNQVASPKPRKAESNR